MRICARAMSEDLRRQRDDLHELLRPQLARHRAEDAGADRLAVLAHHHGTVGVELDVAAVRPLQLALGAHDHRASDLALLDLAVDHRLLDGDDDHVADGGVPALGAAEHLDAGDLLRARVVGHIEDRRHLDHMTWPSGFTWTSASALTRTSATRQRFSFDIGRVSTMRTLSPGFADCCSSWHLYFFFSVRYLPYWPCLARRAGQLSAAQLLQLGGLHLNLPALSSGGSSGCSGAACGKRGPSLPGRSRESPLPSRRGCGPSSPPRATPRRCPCRAPCASRPASW